MSVESTLKTIEGINVFLNTIESVSYGSNAIQYLNLGEYGQGKAAFDKLKSEFQNLDFSKLTKISALNKQINDKNKELQELEEDHASLVSIFGEDGSASKGTLTHDLMLKLDKEIADLIQTRDDLRSEVNTVEKSSSEKILLAEREANVKIATIEAGVVTSQNKADLKVSEAEAAADGKVRIINQFKDFLEETNSNMSLYYWVIIILSVGAVVTVGLCVPELLTCFESYNKYLMLLGCNASSWQLLNSAFGILIVKLPWALCLSAVFTGIYRLLRNLLITFEKVNQDKRNMSAIYAVSGNIASSLNEYGLSILDEEFDVENETYVAVLKTSKKELHQKRESLKWNQIMNYFEGMQNQKFEDPEPEDVDRFKELAELLKVAIDKIPTGSK